MESLEIVSQLIRDIETMTRKDYTTLILYQWYFNNSNYNGNFNDKTDLGKMLKSVAFKAFQEGLKCFKSNPRNPKFFEIYFKNNLNEICFSAFEETILGKDILIDENA